MTLVMIVCTSLLISLASGQEVVEDDEDPVASLFAVGFATFLGSFALLTISQLNLNPVQPSRRLEDFPTCGTRQDDILEPELCLQGCEWVDSPFNVDRTYETDFINDKGRVKIEVLMDPVRVPVDFSCMNDCIINQKGDSFDPLLALCDAYGLSKSFCYMMGRSYAIEGSDNQEIFTSNKLIYFSETLEDEIFIYCWAEQFQRTRRVNFFEPFNSGSGSGSEPPSFTDCTACQDLLGVMYQQPNAPRKNTPGKGKKKHGKKIKRKNGGKKQKKLKRTGRVGSLSLDYELEKAKTPWLCSLKTAGFRGRHRCGVTLLSGPPKETILVSSAHCNEFCRDEATGRIVEICCCRKEGEPASCFNETSYCGTNPVVSRVEPDEIQIVCGEYSLEEVPENVTPEDERVLTVEEIIVHPNYKNRDPFGGSDIAVYRVSNPEVLADAMESKDISPACLPRFDEDDYLTEFGRITSWRDPEPTFRSAEDTLDNYIRNNLTPIQKICTIVECGDPVYMNSNTFYPPGTVCFFDPSLNSCVTFGNSGSPMVREFEDSDGEPRFAFVGPLSLSKGCDRTTITEVFVNRYNASITKYNFKSENPAVFTDALCYLDFIAESYDLLPPNGWKKPESCSSPGIGDPDDKDQEFCMTDRGTMCDFTPDWPECRLQAFEGYAYNIYQCLDTEGFLANCANNCRGVNPNSIVIGGTAVAFAAVAGGATLLGPALGAGALGAVGVGGFMMNNNCLPGQCRPPGSNTCCMLRFVNGNLRCPRSC